MKWSILLVLASLSLYAKAEPPHWSYQSPNGPFQWGNMEGYSTCSTGREQSPIDIEAGDSGGIVNVTPDSQLENLHLHWKDSPLSILNNGHTLQVPYAKGSFISYQGSDFELLQFHFHSPSEHILNGKQYPLEAHFVHSQEGKLLVVGVFFEEGQTNSSLEDIWSNAPDRLQTVNLPVTIDAKQFLPRGENYFNYHGSLTTPPCSKGVTWIVLKEPIQASRAQLQFLQQKMGGPNNRPIEPNEARMIGTFIL